MNKNMKLCGTNEWQQYRWVAKREGRRGLNGTGARRQAAGPGGRGGFRLCDVLLGSKEEQGTRTHISVGEADHQASRLSGGSQTQLGDGRGGTPRGDVDEETGKSATPAKVNLWAQDLGKLGLSPPSPA